jgi:fumarylacetoacetate (FAA) hydrolase
LQAALEQWSAVAPQLAAISSFPDMINPASLTAPLPRAWQWLDGSAFACHGELMDKVIRHRTAQDRTSADVPGRVRQILWPE